MEGMIDDNDKSINDGWRRWDSYEIANHDREEREYENEHEDEERCECLMIMSCRFALILNTTYSNLWIRRPRCKEIDKVGEVSTI
ncbi:hypothetical protein Tco_0642514 [Tanacetum coccineum]